MILSKLYDRFFKSHWVDCGTIALVQKVKIVDEGYTESVTLSYTIWYNTQKNTFKIYSRSSNSRIVNSDSHKLHSIIRNDMLDFVAVPSSNNLRLKAIKEYIRDANK